MSRREETPHATTPRPALSKQGEKNSGAEDQDDGRRSTASTYLIRAQIAKNTRRIRVLTPPGTRGKLRSDPIRLQNLPTPMGCRCCGGTFLAARSLSALNKARISAAQRFPVASLLGSLLNPASIRRRHRELFPNFRIRSCHSALRTGMDLSCMYVKPCGTVYHALF